MDSHDKTDINDFCLADLHLRIVFNGTENNNMELISSFEPFREKLSDGEKLFTLAASPPRPSWPPSKSRW